MSMIDQLGEEVIQLKAKVKEQDELITTLRELADALREKLQAKGSTYEKVTRLEAKVKELESDLRWARGQMVGR
jgi:predicted RNase H-like nuclease (RuvC/YqgF family)